MPRSFTAALRRAKRLMRPARTTKTTRAIQQAMTGLIISSVFAPLAVLSPKKIRPRKRTAQKIGHSLGAVIQQLSAAQSLLPTKKAGPDRIEPSPRIPKSARYLSRKHRSAAGTRGYKIYLPASQPDRPKGLILMLHGCNQTPDDFARGSHMNAHAEKHGLAIAYPEQTHGYNAGLCWNWFRPGHQVRDTGEPAILGSLTRKLMKELGLGRDAVFVAGLSAGGAMAAILADVYPDLFSAAGVHSGLARGAARDVMTAASAMRSGGTAESPPPAVARESLPVRRIVFHGDADTTVHPSNATMIGAAAMGGLAQPTRRSEWSVRGRSYVRSDFAGSNGVIMLEVWMLLGAGHAWSGGRAAGSYTDRNGPDASAQMIRFFLNKRA